jgi:sugar fermentation stimulation protein A
LSASAAADETREDPARAGAPIRLPVRAALGARLLRRYKRFFADVETAAGEKLTVHCPNPGSMRGLLVEGAPVRCSTSDDPRRKLRHTLEMIRIGRTWVGLHTGRANGLAERVLTAGAIPALGGYANLHREVVAPPLPGHEARSRLDFRLSGHARDPRPHWVEVKSVTLAEGRVARFPDSVTERGRRHAEVLSALVERGARASLLFVVQRADCERVEPADDIDPAYGQALRDAAGRGVGVLALRVRVGPRGLGLDGPLPVTL